VSDEADPPKKKGKGMLFGIVGALLLGGGGAFATYSGMIELPFGPGAKTEHVEAKPVAATMPEVAYVELDPIVVDFGRGGRDGRFRIALAIETAPVNEDVVDQSRHRITDTLYSFLRAVKEDDLRNPSKTDLLRSRILRRVLLETPPGAVSDVLISELVIL
jgi:flagellar FliL protein